MDNESQREILRLHFARIRATRLEKATYVQIHRTRFVFLLIKPYHASCEFILFRCFLTENAGTPYAATVSINDMQYGVGYGTSKKQAKSDAAKATLEILIPEMRSKITADSKTGGSNATKSQDQDLSVSNQKLLLLSLKTFKVFASFT